MEVARKKKFQFEGIRTHTRLLWWRFFSSHIECVGTRSCFQLLGILYSMQERRSSSLEGLGFILSCRLESIEGVGTRSCFHKYLRAE